MAKSSFNIDSKDLAGKVKMSKLVCAWTSAKARATEQDRTEAGFPTKYKTEVRNYIYNNPPASRVQHALGVSSLGTVVQLIEGMLAMDTLDESL